MKFIAFLSLAVAAMAAPDSDASAKALNDLSAWLKTPREQRAAPGDFAAVTLTKDDAAKALAVLWNDRLSFLRATREAEMRDKTIALDGKTMKFGVVYFGSKEDAPAGGRCLFLSMHGGGGGPAEMNDSQWQNQIALARATPAPMEISSSTAT